MNIEEIDRLISLNEVLNIIPLSQSTIYRKIKECTFPGPVRISRNRNAWSMRDIQQYIADPSGWSGAF